MKLADRRGNIEECSSGQDRLLEWIYTHETGRFLMKGLINPHISEIGAAFLDSRASRVLIAWFIRKNKIPMYQYEQKKYRSFNEFFKRKALPGARRIIREPERLISLVTEDSVSIKLKKIPGFKSNIQATVQRVF